MNQSTTINVENPHCLIWMW